MATPKFASSSLSVHTELRNRVSEYFKNADVKSTGNAALYTKAVILFSLLFGLYIHLVFFTPAAWLGILECMLLGLVTAGIGFNVMHDGAHGSFSNNPTVNRIAAYTLDFLGGSSFMWNNKHNIVHHTYTNIDGVDDDIEARPFLRLAPTQKRYKAHKYQHYYFWALYSLLYLFWVFFTDYRKYFTGAVGSVPIKKLKPIDHILFWGFKVFYIGVYVALPIYMVGFMPWLVGFLAYTCTGGFVLSIVFQLAHTVEETSFPEAQMPANKMEDEWALHQLKTTANFATNNKLITWYVGGLNFQIEHHLFPKISHAHYPHISKIVKQACKDMGVPYIEHKWMLHAVSSHISHLKKMGSAETIAA
jgi:linoleoyl-CoA desaturase